jgi:hypothetical protein
MRREDAWWFAAEYLVSSTALGAFRAHLRLEACVDAQLGLLNEGLSGPPVLRVTGPLPVERRIGRRGSLPVLPVVVGAGIKGGYLVNLMLAEVH